MIAAILALLVQASALSGSAELTNQAKVKNLMLVQLWSKNPDEFLKEWNQPTPPNLKTSTTIERNKTIEAFVIFAGCKGDALGNCNLNGSYVIRDPDGAVYGEQSNIDFWSGPELAGKELRLSPVGARLTIEDREKLGVYTVRITATDRNSGATAVTEENLKVVEAATK